MAELVRPLPPRTLGARARAWASTVTPVRVASGAGAVLLVAVTAWWLLAAPPAPVERSLPRATASGATASSGPPAPSATSATSGSSGSSGVTPATSGPPSTVVVQVAGAVARPGLLRLATGSRVADAIEAAGGTVEGSDLAAVNLAARVADGQRVVVPRVGQAAADPHTEAAPDRAGGAAPREPLDLNEATAVQLESLPGVGPATAAAIVAQRTKVGRFLRLEDLLEVRGIGPARLEALREQVRL